LLLQPTPYASKSLLFAEIKKDSLLTHVVSPRIIFVGGSNLSFGLNSQIIKDSISINPINTAIHAGLGLKYMLDNSVRFIRRGDIVVLIPEYQLFYEEYNYGSEELLRMVVDVDKSKIRLLSLEQLFRCCCYSGNLLCSKFDKNEYLHVKESDVYSVNSYNQYGDVYTHRKLGKRAFSPYLRLDTNAYCPEVLSAIKDYNSKIHRKGAILFLSYPCYQDTSFYNSYDAIQKIEREYTKNDFIILGYPERYIMNDSLMFDTPYHPTGKGADYRTKLLISDIKDVLTKISWRRYY
jgi:hypothetical protein